jgi:2-hydroxychromene-2-carboxylate isomerase
MAFADGVDLTARAAVLRAGEHAGFDSGDLDQALDDPALKRALRDANDAAITAGVYGVPTLDAGGLLWWGDQLVAAAAAAHGSTPD